MSSSPSESPAQPSGGETKVDVYQLLSELSQRCSKEAQIIASLSDKLSATVKKGSVLTKRLAEATDEVITKRARTSAAVATAVIATEPGEDPCPAEFVNCKGGLALILDQGMPSDEPLFLVPVDVAVKDLANAFDIKEPRSLRRVLQQLSDLPTLAKCETDSKPSASELHAMAVRTLLQTAWSEYRYDNVDGTRLTLFNALFVVKLPFDGGLEDD